MDRAADGLGDNEKKGDVSNEEGKEQRNRFVTVKENH